MTENPGISRPKSKRVPAFEECMNYKHIGADSRRYDRPLRQELWRKCPGRLLYRAEGPSSGEGRRLNRRQRLRRLAERHSDVFDSATKAALRSFVRAWTAEQASKGIRANMVSPGPIETPLLEAHFRPNVGAMKDRFMAMTPMHRIGQPEEIASAVLFLASDESSFITGVDLPVDGGTVAV